MDAKEFQLIKISGEPFERGVQYGTQACDKIRRGLELYKKRFKDVVKHDWPEILEQSRDFLPLVESYAPELVEELRGIATGAGVEFEEILALNCRTELQVERIKSDNDGCTSAVVLPEATLEKKLILGQNWDYRPWAIDTAVLLSVEYPNGVKILGLAEAGQLLRNGLNNFGIGVCANFIRSSKDYGGVGIPVTFVRRKLLSCDRFSDAMGAVFNAPRTISANYLLACKDGMAVDLEATPDDVYPIFPQDGFYAHANHIQTVGLKDIFKGRLPDSQYRDKRLFALLKQKAGSITMKDFMDCFKDHFGYPDSICRHYDERDSHIAAMESNASIVMDLAQSKLFVSYGPPCQSEYVEYSL